MIYQQTTSKQTGCPFDLLLSVIHSSIPKRKSAFLFSVSTHSFGTATLRIWKSQQRFAYQILFNGNFKTIFPSTLHLQAVTYFFLLISFQQTNEASLKNKAKKVCIKTNGTSQSRVGNCLLLGRQTELF
jgi:hypothetical protein